MVQWSTILAALVAVSLAGAACGIAGEVDTVAPENDGVWVDALMASARRANLRVLEGEHVVIITDRPARAGDGVEDLPRIFDAAWDSWRLHFGLDPKQHRQWRALGCLVVDRERFRTAGLLPAAIPDFANGFCARGRFWMADQSSPAYRRHLLLHEGVHAFTLTLRSLDTPPWYTEGIAEFLATHRLEGETDPAGRFMPTPFPLRAEDVEQLGRIEKLRALRAAGACPGLDEVFATPGVNHRDLSAYAASWAAVAMLSLHPTYARAFAEAERGPLDSAFSTRLTQAAGWDTARAERDFDAFTDEIDYGYDFTRSLVDWSPAKPLDTPQTIEVDSRRGWQNSGWSLTKAARYAVKATGRCTIGSLPGDPPAGSVRLESEAAGISLRWYRGRPLGRLLVAQWMDNPNDGGRARFVVLAEGDRGLFTALTDGVAYCKLNEPPGELADNDGHLAVVLERVESEQRPR